MGSGSKLYSSKSDTDESATLSNVADRNITAMVRMEQDALTHRTVGERIADTVTGLAVRPWFIGLHALAYTTWVLANTAGPWRFDPWPFNLLNSIIAVEAIFVTLLVLTSQQRMIRLSDRRAHLNLQVDLLAEQEMTAMIRMLERLFEHFKLDPAAAAPQAAELRKTTDLKALVEKLDSSLNKGK
jgi:uncharacterized membrane protein